MSIVFTISLHCTRLDRKSRFYRCMYLLDAEKDDRVTVRFRLGIYLYNVTV